VLLLIVGILLVIGLSMVYSASVVVAYTTYRDEYYFMGRQALFALVGLIGMAIAARVDYRFWGRFAALALFGCLLLLILVLVPGLGVTAWGAQRWLRLGLLSVQPSELTKLALVLYMARWLAAKREQVSDLLSGFLPFCIILVTIVVLLMRQPDMGTTIVLAATAGAAFFAAGASLAQLSALVVLGAGVGAVLIRLSAYRLARWNAFLDPWKDAERTGYHVVQALLALGAGGLTGLGPGVSRQKFLYLPFPHTDSIYAVIGEELGLMGTLSVLLLFVAFAWRGLHIAWHAPDDEGRLLAVGITCNVVFQALLNIAVLTSSIPFTGIPLPFISYGGSSLAVTLVETGLLLSVSRRTVGQSGALPAWLAPLGWLRRRSDAHPGSGRRDRRAHLPRAGRPERAGGRAG